MKKILAHRVATALVETLDLVTKEKKFQEDNKNIAHLSILKNESGQKFLCTSQEARQYFISEQTEALMNFKFDVLQRFYDDLLYLMKKTIQENKKPQCYKEAPDMFGYVKTVKIKKNHTWKNKLLRLYCYITIKTEYEIHSFKQKIIKIDFRNEKRNTQKNS